MSKWIPKLFFKTPDGGKNSGVTAYFLIEWKPFFSIGILRFSKGSREAFHTHAFNAFTWFIKGSIVEELPNGHKNYFGPSIIPKYTPRENCHKVIANKTTYAITFRGRWRDKWRELRNNKTEMVTLTHGRKVVDIENRIPHTT